MSLHRACCCCKCPETLTLELRGSLPIDIACPANVPTSPPFASVGPYFDCVGSIDDQIETVSIVSQGSGSNLPCYFSSFLRWCSPAFGSPAWPLIQDWSLNVTRTLCAGFSNVGGFTPCFAQGGAAPTFGSTGAFDGHASIDYLSGYDALNSRHWIQMYVLVPSYLEQNGWAWSEFIVRAYKASSSRTCFPRGKYTLYNTTNNNTHGWVETHVTSFNNKSGLLVYTTTRRSVASPPFEIWIT